MSELENQIKEANNQKLVESRVVASADKALRIIVNFQKQYKVFKNDLDDQLQLLGVQTSDIVELRLDVGPIQEMRAKSEESLRHKDALADPKQPKSLTSQANKIKDAIADLQSRLDEPNKRYEEYKEAVRLWETQKAAIVGDATTFDSIYYFQHLREEAELAPKRLENAKAQRLEITKTVYSKIQELVGVYQTLYRPIQEFIDTHPIANDQFRLAFDVSIVNDQFDQRFFDWIGHNVVGSFYGQTAGEKFLQDILERYDFNSLDQTLEFLQDVMDHLTHDKRTPNSPEIPVRSQMRKGQSVESFYDYIFSLGYLRPRYVLKLGDKELNLLSPGERGALLLIFYLLIDKDNVPLIIDQPDENLDNQTVYELLVACIKEAKQRRQILIVTHNPNLAVVCDAEQIICCSIDKADGNRIQYLTGAIENPIINQRVVDILEGTAPAFKNRRSKYQTMRL